MHNPIKNTITIKYENGKKKPAAAGVGKRSKV
jgi:hypothetical protein